MRDDFPQPVPGPDLKEARRRVGVRQKDLAARLDMHRVTLHDLEKEPEVDAIRAARYQDALAELAAEALARRTAA